jgi:hypothetical protein
MRTLGIAAIVLVVGLATLSVNASGGRSMIALSLTGLVAVILLVLLAATVVMAEVERLDASALE